MIAVPPRGVPKNVVDNGEKIKSANEGSVKETAKGKEKV